MLALKSFCMQQEESAAEEHIDQGDDNKKDRIMQGSKDADISQMLHTTTNEGKSYVPEDLHTCCVKNRARYCQNHQKSKKACSKQRAIQHWESPHNNMRQ